MGEQSFNPIETTPLISNSNTASLIEETLKKVLEPTNISEQEKISNFHHAVDNIMQSFPFVCRSECCACCYQPVDVYPQEAELIKQFIRNNLSKEDRHEIKKGCEDFVENYNQIYELNIEFWDEVLPLYEYMLDKLSQRHMECPFLKNNICLIYPVRPTMCRTHAMTSEPEKCFTHNTRNPSWQSRLVAITAHALLTKLNNGKGPNAIVHTLSETIDLKHPLKGF